MNKAEFLKELDRQLSGLPKEERQRSVEFYSEMIDDRIEDGDDEATAVSRAGSPRQIAEELMGESARQGAGKRRVNVWTVVFAVLASPIWLPILAAAAAVVISVYISVWAIVVSIAAAGIGIAAGALGGIAAALIMLFTQPPADAAFIFGCALILAGASVFVLLAAIYSVRVTIKGTAWLIGKVGKKTGKRGAAA